MNTKKRKTKQLHISISEEDLATIDSLSKRAAMSRSEYVRWSALNYNIQIPPVPSEILTSVCKISTILNQNNHLDIKNTQILKEEVDSIWRSLKL